MHECTHIRRRVHLLVYMFGVWTCIIARARGNGIYTWLGHTHTRGETYTRGSIINTRWATDRAERLYINKA